MADYFSLLAKLLEGLPGATSQVRDGVYGRARRALREQLKTVQPPLSEEEIDRESRGLEDAIRRIEATFPTGATGVEVAAPDPPVVPSPVAASPAAERPTPARSETVAIRRGGKRQTSRAPLIALVLAAIPVGIVAWLWRQREPSPAPEILQAPVAAAPAQPELKYGERVAGNPTSGRPPSASSAPREPTSEPAATPPQPGTARGSAEAPAPPSGPAGGVPAPAGNPGSASQSGSPTGGDLAVAQRALIFEENQLDPQQPIISTGRAIWRLDAVNGGQGLALETIIRGRVDLPSAGLSLSIVVRRNVDAALPASHTIELTFAMSDVSGNPPRVVRDVALPVMRPEESIRGVPVAGLPVPVKENVFLIGLSDLKADIDRNMELLLRRNWMELPIRFASGQKAALLFDKGVSGERVFQDAFRQWGQVP